MWDMKILHMGGGMFVNEVEKNPHAVVLFDEVEKAHRDVSNMLLQVMDYGTCYRF